MSALLRRLSLLGLCTLPFACVPNPWPDPTPAPRVAHDARLGPPLWEGAPMRDTIFDTVWKNDHFYVAISQGRGRRADLSPAPAAELDFFEYDLGAGALKALPAWPFAAAPASVSWTLEPAGFLAWTSTPLALALFDGSTWHPLPAPPAAPSVVVARDAATVLVRSGTRVFVLRDGAFAEVAASVMPGASAVALGPWDASGARLVWTDAQQACTTLLDTTTLAPRTAAVCKTKPGGATLHGDALNGTVDDFQVFFSMDARNGVLWHFASAAWERGDLLQAKGLRATPGSTTALLDVAASTFDGSDYDSTDGLIRAVAGKKVDGVLAPIPAWLWCSCVRRDAPECGCAERNYAHQFVLDRTGTRGVLMSLDTADARRFLSARRIDLPASEAAMGEPSCAPVCTGPQLCQKTDAQAARCVWDSTAAGGVATLHPAEVQFAFFSASGQPATPELSLLDPEGRPLAGVTASVRGFQTVVSGPAGTRIHAVAQLARHAERPLDFTLPEENTGPDAGPFFLSLGTRLGLGVVATGAGRSYSAVLSRAGPAAKGALVVAVVDDDGAKVWKRVSREGPGLAAQVLAPAAGSPGPARVSPDERVLLLSDDVSGLKLFDTTTWQPLTTPASASTAPWDTSRVTFAPGTPSRFVAVRRGPFQSPNGGEVPAATSILELSASGANELAVLPVPGTAVQLSADGRMVLRLEGSTWVARSVGGQSWTLGAAQVARLAGDGSRVYFGAYSNGTWAVTETSLEATSVTRAVASGVAAFAVDLAGADAFSVQHQPGGVAVVSRHSAATGAASTVTTTTGGGSSDLASGALWLIGESSTSLLLPPNFTARPFAGAWNFFARERGELGGSPYCRSSSCEVALVSATGVQRLPGGSNGGVFGENNERRVVPPGTVQGLDPVAGGSQRPLSITSPNGPPPSLDTRFVRFGALFPDGIGAPCALYALPRRVLEVSARGQVRWTTDGEELFCVE